MRNDDFDAGVIQDSMWRVWCETYAQAATADGDMDYGEDCRERYVARQAAHHKASTAAQDMVRAMMVIRDLDLTTISMLDREGDWPSLEAMFDARCKMGEP